MKPTKELAAFVALLGLACTSREIPELPARLGRSVPTISAAAVLSGPATWPEGSWTVVNYWHFACGPCIREMPELQSFASSQDHVAVVGLSYFFDPTEMPIDEQLARFRQAQSVGASPFPTFIVKAHKDLEAFEFHAIPTTLLVDPDGVVVHEARGTSQLQALLAEASRVR